VTGCSLFSIDYPNAWSPTLLRAQQDLAEGVSIPGRLTEEVSRFRRRAAMRRVDEAITAGGL